MKPGYKQTDLGLLPEEWEVKTLGEIGVPVIGLTYDPANISDDGVLVLRSSNIQNEELDLDNQVRVKMRIPEKTYVQEDDLLICVRNGSRSLIGKCLLLDKRVEGAAFGAFMAVYRSPINKFIVHAFKSHIVAKQIEENLGATINSITNKDLSSYKIPLPPLAEQQAIAEALGAVDALLTSQRGLLAKKQDLKQAAQQALLSGETRLPGFAGEWQMKMLGEVSQIKTGKKNNDDKIEGGKYPFFVRSQDVERINSYSFDGEAILLPGEGNIGSIFHYIDGKFDYHQRVYKVSNFSPDVSGKFVYYYMKEFFGEHAMINSVKAAVDSLRLPTFQEFEIKYPSPDEQRAIAAMLSDIEAELEALAAQVAKTQALKQGMMQDLLTGAVRLAPAAAAPSTTLTPSTAA